MNQKNQKQIVIIGPTASGKSALAIELAKKFKGEIISSDSRQIYRGLNIGAGKEPGKLEEIYYTENGNFKITKNLSSRLNLGKSLGSTLSKNEIHKTYICENTPHFMIDIAHPNTLYSVEKFVKKAEKTRKEIWQRKNLPIICGGTMFWAQALVEKQKFPKVPPNEKLRQELSQKNSIELLEILKNLDPERAEDIIKKNEVNNLVRLIRAIEIATVLGKVPKIENVGVSHWQTQNTLIIAVSHPREVLYEKIEKRMDQWFDDGIFEEIKKLHLEMRVSWKRLESFGLEYKWCSRFVCGKIGFDEMRKNTIQDLKNYAKRQQTWIKRWEKSGAKIHHLNNLENAEKLVENFLKNENF